MKCFGDEIKPNFLFQIKLWKINKRRVKVDAEEAHLRNIKRIHRVGKRNAQVNISKILKGGHVGKRGFCEDCRKWLKFRYSRSFVDKLQSESRSRSSKGELTLYTSSTVFLYLNLNVLRWGKGRNRVRMVRGKSLSTVRKFATIVMVTNRNFMAYFTIVLWLFHR